MKRNRSLMFAFLLTLTFAGSALAQLGTPQTTFRVVLTSSQLLPPLGALQSEMEGEGTITFDTGMRYARVIMKIRDNFSAVTDVHLHLADAGKGNGVDDIVVAVEESLAVTTRSFTVLAVFRGAEKVDSVNNIASLYQAVRDGRVYLDVHSTDFPDGEIRGQIFPQ